MDHNHNQGENTHRPLYFSVFPGNGPQVIRDALVKRGNWKEISKDVAFDKANFVWKPTNFNYKVSSIITTITLLIFFLCQMYSKIDKILKDPAQSQQIVVNHLENIRGICTKTGLVRTLKQYYKDRIDALENGYSVFDSTPTTFVVTSQLDTYEFHQFVSRYNDLQKNEGFSNKERTPLKHCKENYWLVKPANLNQGRGIEIFNNLQEIQRFLSSQQSYSYWVIQKYVERPLLFKGRKFDIRVWSFASHKMDFYFYKKGYLRTSSDSYSLDNENNYVHLTNNCLQKFGENYGKHEDGNTIGFEAFQEYLDKVFPQHKLNVEEHFLKRIKDLMIDVYLSVRKTINPHKRKNSFELFGFDFLVDEDFRVWLIEVNTNPYLGIPNTYIKELLPKMVDDLFKIVLDPVYNQNDAPIDLTDNGFECLYSQGLSINKRRQIDEGVYPVPELAQIRKRPQKPKINNFKRQRNSVHVESQNDNDYEQQQYQNSNKKKQDLSQSRSKLISSTNEGVPSQRNLKSLLLNSPYIQGKRFNQYAYNMSKNETPSKQDDMKRSIRLKPLNLAKQNSTSNLQGNNRFRQPQHSGFLSQREQIDEELDNHQNEFLTMNNFNHRNDSIDESTYKNNVTISNFTPQKTITDQVNQLRQQNSTFKKDVQNIVNRIVTTFQSWELFSDKQILDASQAFNLLATNYHFSCFCDETIIGNIMKVIGSKKTPSKIKLSIIQTFILILKNISFKKFLLQHIQTPIAYLQQIIDIALESCSISDYDEEQSELYQSAIRLLICLLCLNQRKFYIPGETTEMEKLRQRAIDHGIYQLVYFIYLKNNKENIQSLIKINFFDLLEEQDFNYLVSKQRPLKNMFTNEELIMAEDEVDAFIKDKYQLFSSQRSQIQKEEFQKKQQQQIDNQRKKDLAEREVEEKRKKAEEQFSRRMEEKRKLQLEIIRKEMNDREQFLKDEDERKRQLIEQLRKKDELRKQTQLEIYKKRLEEENKKAEEIEKRRQEKEEERKRVLEEWHKNKVKRNPEIKNLNIFRRNKNINKLDPLFNEALGNESLDMLNKESFNQDQTIDINRESIDNNNRQSKNATHLSLTGTLTTPSQKVTFKFSYKNVSQQRQKQKDDNSYEESSMKPSKSVKAFYKKGSNQNSKEQMKNEILYSVPMTKAIHMILPALANNNTNDVNLKLNENDIRLFSIYGYPQQRELIINKKVGRYKIQQKRKKEQMILGGGSILVNSQDDIEINNQFAPHD